MSDLVSPWVRRFLVEHLIGERNCSTNTQKCYRDTFVLFLPFAAKRSRCAIDRLELARIKPKLVREFLSHLDQARDCSPATVNVRLATIRAWARFVATHRPEHLEWCSHLLSIPLKKQASRPVGYLEKDEVQALLAAPDRASVQGFRDYTLLLFLYNTGARVSEACQLIVGELDLRRSVVTLHGKGNRDRRCLLWPVTISALRLLMAERPAADPVFLNQRGQPLTRYGIHTLVERYVRRAAIKMPSLIHKRVSPHVLRHTTGTHLLRSGVDINTIRIWLGHVSLETTNIYAESDLDMKAKALARCEGPLLQPSKNPRTRRGLMGFLREV